MRPIADIVRLMGSKDQGVAFYAYHELLGAVTGGQVAEESERAALATDLAKELNAMVPGGFDDRGNPLPPKMKHSAAVRNKIARLLSYIGSEVEVPALSKAMEDLEVREMARFALDGNACESATQALIAALEEVGPIFRVGVVNSLAARNGPDALAALKKAASDSDREVRIAAVEALSSFADPSCDPIIAQAASSGSPHDRNRAIVARLRLADRLRASGQTEAASRIYREIQASSTEPAHKRAAEIGLRGPS